MSDFHEWDAEVRAAWAEEPPDDFVGEPAPAGALVAAFFDRAGLLTDAVARDVMNRGPIMYGPDGTFWHYRRGVYRPDANRLEITTRIARALGDRFRKRHAEDVREYLSTLVPLISADPVTRYINMESGMLDWQADPAPVLHPHGPEIASTVQLPVAWDTDARCPAFDAFLADVLHGDDIPRMWEIIGYAMLSGNPLQRAFMLTGSGLNGKGALLRTVQALIGRGNYSSVSLHDLSGDRFAAADLHGKLANICGDIDATYIESTGLFKQVTGNDTIRAQRKYGQAFEFEPWCSFFFSCNEIPRSSDSSSGWSRRFEVIDFAKTVRKDPAVEPAMQAPESLRGIAARAVGALRDLMARGDFTVTASGAAAKTQFEMQSNPVRRWLSDCTFPADDGWVSRAELWESYKKWEVEERLRAVGRKVFYTRLRQLEASVHIWERSARVAGESVRGFGGLLLNEHAHRGSWEPPADEEPPDAHSASPPDMLPGLDLP